MKFETKNGADLSVQIAQTLRAAIIDGELAVDSKLPSEADLAERFNVSRSTIREALKRLSAQNLIRTKRGAAGGAFVKCLTFEEANAHKVATTRLLVSMNGIGLKTVCEAHFALLNACIQPTVANLDALAGMQAELTTQTHEDLDDAAFWTSFTSYYCAFIAAAQNPLLRYQLAGSAEGLAMLLAKTGTTPKLRVKIIGFHGALLDALKTKRAALAEEILVDLQIYLSGFAENAPPPDAAT